MASQKLNFCNYVIGWYIQKEQDKNCLLAKYETVSANWVGDISIIVLR